MEEYFLNHLGLDWKRDKARMLCRKNRLPWRGPTRLAHMTAQEYLKYGYLSQEQFDSMYKFAFVRNPWARLVSEYNYAGYDEKWSFAEWVLEHFPTAKDEKGLFQKGGYRHVMPQLDYLVDDKGEMILDFVGKFESITEDFAKVCQDLGIHDKPLPHKNSGKKRQHYSEYYTPAAQKRVAEMYAKEIEMFGYSYEG